MPMQIEIRAGHIVVYNVKLLKNFLTKILNIKIQMMASPVV